MVLDSSFLNARYYMIGIIGKWSNPEKSVALFPIPRCSSYSKGSLRVTLDYGEPTYSFIVYIYIE